MPRHRGEIQPFDPETERTCRAIKKETRSARQITTMAENHNNNQNQNQNQNQRLLRDYAIPDPVEAQASILRPTVNANNFEIKPGLIQMVQQGQFGGNPTEDPNAHLANFLEICNTIKMNGVNEDAIRLRLFPFSLRDKAKVWLNSKAPNSFTTWTAVSQAFLSKYFPPGKTAKLTNNITSFVQFDGKSLYEAWERFKKLQ